MPRGYYRGGPASYVGGGGFTRAIKALVIANGVVFALQIFDGIAGGGEFVQNFGLRPYSITHQFFLWQLVTYIFLHGGFFHILFNMFALWMFGGELERSWGSREFLRFFFVCGIGAGISSVLMEPNSMIPTIGASGAVYGILLAYGLLFPNRIIYLYMIIPMPAKYFVMMIGGIAFMASFSGGGGGVAHIAHLGGMVFGFLYLRRGKFGGVTRGIRDYYDRWRRERLRRKFDVYYNKRHKEQQRNDDDDDDGRRWRN